MKQLLSAIVFVSVFAAPFGFASAEETSTTTSKHEEHQTDGKTSEEHSEHGMGMMHECMEKHKDGKMCEHKCASEMSQDECHKMMSEMMKNHKNKMKKQTNIIKKGNASTTLMGYICVSERYLFYEKA